MQGYGKAVVCAVGDYEKYPAKNKKKASKSVADKSDDLNSQNTPIEEHLIQLGDSIESWGFNGALLAFSALTLLWILMNFFSSHRSFFTCDSFSYFLENLQIGAVLVLITEPRAILKLVRLSLAFS